MSLGPSCLLGIGRAEAGALLHRITRPTTSNEGAHSPWVLLVDPLALDGGALEAAPLPLAIRLPFDGGGDGHRLAALDLSTPARLLVEWRVHERHRGAPARPARISHLRQHAATGCGADLVHQRPARRPRLAGTTSTKRRASAGSRARRRRTTLMAWAACGKDPDRSDDLAERCDDV